MPFRVVAFSDGQLVVEVRMVNPHLFFMQIVIGCDSKVREM
jgi:hypothetical protein